MARRTRRYSNYNATASLYVETGDDDEITLTGEIEIIVDFTYTPGQPQTYDEPGYGPEITDWSGRLADDSVPLPMAAQQALDKFVEYHMQNDPHGWVDSALCDAGAGY